MTARPGHLALLTFAMLLVLGRGVLGAEPAPALHLILRSEAPDVLEPQSLRAMLETELGRPVILNGDAAAAADGATLTIIYRAAGNELTVSYLAATGEPVTRTVSAPEAHGGVAPLAVLLAGNLARDQTTELLDVRTSRPERIASGATLPTVEVRAGASPDVDLSARLVGLGKRAHPLAWSESLSLLNVGAEISGRVFYAQLGASFHPEEGRALVGPVVAVGARLPLGNLPFAGEGDIGFIYFRGVGSPEVPPDTVVYTATRLISRLRVALVYAARPRLDLFAGAALALTTHFYAAPSNDFGPELFGGIRL
ncbi:MAG TPA: hypothetical protein VI456_17475 [Polyangia bacterium]